MPKTSSVDAAIVAERNLAGALTNPSPAALFSQFGDARQQAIVDLAKIFESAIAKPAPPIVVPPHPAVLTVPPPYPRVTFPPVPPRVLLSVQLNFINLYYNGNNFNAVALPCYHLGFHRQQRPLAEQEPHYIATNTSAIAQPPRFLSSAGSCFVRATRHLIATEHRRTNHANTVIDTFTGQSLEYRHLIHGPKKVLWTTSLANDLGRIAQGVSTQMPKGKNTVFFGAPNRNPFRSQSHLLTTCCQHPVPQDRNALCPCHCRRQQVGIP